MSSMHEKHGFIGKGVYFHATITQNAESHNVTHKAHAGHIHDMHVKRVGEELSWLIALALQEAAVFVFPNPIKGRRASEVICHKSVLPEVFKE